MYLKPDPIRIKRNFGLIAEDYDRANDWMSLGLLHKWRRQLLKLSEAQKGQRVIDVATGTGDLAFLFSQAVGVEGEVVGLDFTSEMIEIARDKEWQLDLPMKWRIGDALELPYEENHFDISSNAFGIRNVENPLKAIKEMARVTRSGGKVLILETGRPDHRLWGRVYSTYFDRMIKKIGGIVAGFKEPYDFLYESTMGFPSGEEFANMMRDSEGFSSVQHIPLLGGVAYIYLAEVR